MKHQTLSDPTTVADYRLIEARHAELVETNSRMLDHASRENRDLMASEARSFDAAMAEITHLKELMDYAPRGLANEARHADIVESRNRLGLPLDLGAPGRSNGRDSLHSQLMAGEKVDLPIGAMMAGKRTLADGRLSKFETRDIVTTSTGAPVPIVSAGYVYEYLVESSGVMRSNVQILSTPNGASFRLPKFTAYSTAAQYAEAAAIAEADPTFATVTLGAHKYACLTSWSREIQEDTDVNLSAYLATNLATALGQTYSPKLINGSGSGEPLGAFTSAVTGVTSGTGVAGVPTIDNILDLFFSLPAPYRQNASWIMRDSTLAAIAKLKDSTNRYFLTPSISADVPATLLGRPVYTDPSVPATGTGAKSVLFGDMSRYFVVRMAGDLRVEVDQSAQFEQDMVVMKAALRIDSKVVDPNAAKVFIGAAS
jgi:HK97 family phage major capsid protein